MRLSRLGDQIVVEPARIGVAYQVLLGLLATSVLSFAVFLQVQTLLFLGVGGALVIAFVLRRADAAIVGYVIVITYLALHLSDASGDGAPGALESFAGLVLFGVALGWILKLRLEEKDLNHSSLHLLVRLFLVWTLIITIGGMMYWGNSWTAALRELANFLPLVVLPILYGLAFESESKREKNFMIFLLCCALVVFVANIMILRSHLVRALYLYQMGRGGIDPSLGVFIALVMLSCLMTREASRLNKVLGAIFLLSVGVLIISMYRTVWIALVIGLLPLFYMATNKERKRGVIQLFKLGAAGVGIIAPFYVSIPLVRMLAMSYLERFLSSSHLGTDLSLVNRYVEWKMLLRTINLSPLLGFGFGSRFRNFNYILFQNTLEGSSHSGYLFIVFKSGLIGALLLYGTYILFIYRGYKLTQSPHISSISKAYIRGCVAFLISLLFVNYTLNIFGGKTDLLWVGLIWGYLLAHEHRLSKISGRVDTSSALAIPTLRSA